MFGAGGSIGLTNKIILKIPVVKSYAFYSASPRQASEG